jgi:6-pyruvoyl-tetrahydropterin synthase
LDSIVERDVHIVDEILRILKRWDDEYINKFTAQGENQQPSEEQIAMMELFRKKGWV